MIPQAKLVDVALAVVGHLTGAGEGGQVARRRQIGIGQGVARGGAVERAVGDRSERRILVGPAACDVRGGIDRAGVKPTITQRLERRDAGTPGTDDKHAGTSVRLHAQSLPGRSRQPEIRVPSAPCRGREGGARRVVHGRAGASGR